MSSAQVKLAGIFSCPFLILSKLFLGSSWRLQELSTQTDTLIPKSWFYDGYSIWILNSSANQSFPVGQNEVPLQRRNHLVLLDPQWFEEDCKSLLAVLLPLLIATFCLPKRWGRKGKIKLHSKITAKRLSLRKTKPHTIKVRLNTMVITIKTMTNLSQH